MKNFIELNEKYKIINKMGYIKAITNNNNSAGITLEKLLNCTGGDFCIPDFKDIEIKALRNNQNASFDLFNSAPDGSYFYSTKWLAEKYGYPDKDYPSIRVFKGDVFSNKFNSIGLYYKFKLKTDYKRKKIVLEIYNKKYVLLNNDIYWDFDTLKFKLNSKIQKLAIFTTEKNIFDSDLYFKYINLEMFEVKDFETFLELLEKGYIYISFKTGINKSGPYIGKFRDHGTSFKISKNNLEKLFNKISL